MAPEPTTAELVELVNLAHDAILVRELGGRIRFWNQGATAVYGWSAEQAVGRVSHDLLRTRFPEPLASIDRQLEALGAWEGELVHRTAGDEEVVVASRWVLRRNPEPADEVVLEINRDVTAARRAEGALRESEQALVDLFDSASDLIQIVAPDGRLRLANRAWRDTLGYGVEELGGLSPLDVIHPDDRARLATVFEQALDGTAARIETILVARDGREIPVDCVVRPRLDGGTPVAVHAFFRDITVRRRIQTERERRHEAERAAARSLARENERLRELDALKDEFLSVVSHELRTPLATMTGFLELLLQNAPGPEEQSEYLVVVDRNAKRLLRLVDDLRLMAQITAGRFTVRRRPTDLVPLVHEAVEDARPVADAAGVTLRASLPGAPVVVLADGVRIAQLLDNLLSNAVKFTPAGGSVSVTCVPDGGSVTVAVADDGIGIDPVDQLHVFDRFFRSREAHERAIAGCGLGLAIAQAIVEHHQGHIALTSRPGHGTTFAVSLPRDPVPSDEAQTGVGVGGTR